MQTNDSDGPLVPVLFFDATDHLVGAAIMNTKARLKSLEQGSPWIVDGQTGRVLPWPKGGNVLGIEERGGHLAVKVDGASTAAPSPITTAEAASNSQTESPTQGTVPGARPDPAYLYELESLVLKRKRDLPEGSYTTHLFTAGLSKIRKKAGEEAIELLLAQSPDEICNEASDLLYHLTVLFAALDIPWSRVIDTLRKR